ncbi:hypothetical protein SDC9_182072 [bioreactor metagenome]|uniref:Uncharacterized protein n=1 Tax=bioreactor metagenome TaxID=1076179 RepID=A0A645H6F7_9ZZZZ
MVQYIIVETIVKKNISFVVLGVNCPVISQFFGTKHQDTVVSQLIIFYDSKRLIGLSQTNAISDNTASIFFYLLNGTHDTIFLEFV